MRSSIIVSSLFAALAIASPVHQALHKKAYVYDIVYDTVTVTVTAGQEPQVLKIQKTVFVKPVPATTTKAKPTTTKSRRPRPTTSSAAPPPPPPAPVPTTTSPIPPPPPPTTTSEAPVVVFTPEPQPTTTKAAPVVEFTPSPTPQKAPVDSSSGNEVRDIAINFHNQMRAQHDAGPLSWDEGLAAEARITAKKCIMVHDNVGFGQNLASSGDSRPNSSSLGQMMKDGAQGWYDEVNAFKSMGLMGQSNIPIEVFGKVGHFTQFVWKASTKIGCAVNYCGENPNLFGNGFYSYLTVCNYAEAGNMGGAYASNVS